MKLIFATRPSALARWQTGWVIAALQQVWPGLECEERVITTQGDRVLDKPLPEIGGKGLFTLELEAELLSGSVHAAVHSLKDLPVEIPAELTIGCIPARAEVRDALVSAQGWSLDGLPAKARLGTSSLRRAAQALHRRPDLVIEPLRGNIDTRLRKAREGQYDAILLAGAGLIRMGWEAAVSEWLSLEVMLPAPGQGALAVQCRAGDVETLRMLKALEDPSARAAVTAERAFLQGLGGGCSVPVAAYAQVFPGARPGDPGCQLTGRVLSPDGRRIVQVEGDGPDPALLGERLAQSALAQGAAELFGPQVRNLREVADQL
jgi:hydroxymethylbilane synthase